MLEISDLPAVNASLNSLSTIFLVTGYAMIRQRQITRHKFCMGLACFTSTLFLTSYLVYHFNIGSQPFQGVGFLRIVYFSILISHVILAVTVLPLALITVTRGLRKQDERHVAIARWTLPIWLYVSVTGVIVYLMLYQLSN